MLVTVKGVKYNIFWHYIRGPKGNTTTCMMAIDGKTDDEHIVFADAQCHPGDMFSKEMGRRVSLARLLRKIDPVFTDPKLTPELNRLELRAVRSTIWESYWNRLPYEKRPKSAQKEIRFAESRNAGGSGQVGPDGNPVV